MSRHHFSVLQQNQSSPKVAEQNIVELTELAAKLMAFERYHCTTHGERTPVFRLLSMVNEAISEQMDMITKAFANGELTETHQKKTVIDIPF